MKRIQTPGGGFAARLRNTSPTALGSGSTQQRTVRAQVELVGTSCPTSVNASVAIVARDDEGDAVDPGPAVASATCQLGKASWTDQVVVQFEADNCPGGSGPDPGDPAEFGIIEITATVPFLGSADGDQATVSRLVECKASSP